MRHALSCVLSTTAGSVGASGGHGFIDPIEHTGLAPAHESALARLVRIAAAGCVAAHQAVSDDIESATDDFSVIDARNRTHLVALSTRRRTK